MLKERFDYSNEPDEPHHVDMDINQDDLYDEDQFYRESEAIPPAPKLHRELSKSVSEMPFVEPISSSANPPPMRSRDGHQLQGKKLYNSCIWFGNLTVYFIVILYNSS